MTIAATSRMDYVGSNTLATYAFTYPIVAASDLLVTKRDTAGVETTLALNTDYTVAGAGVATGGSITLLAGNLPTSYALTIRRVVSLAQAVDIRNQSGFFPEVLENEFDKLASADQQLNDGVTRSLRAAETDPVLARLPAASLRSGKYLAFDGSGNPILSAGTGNDSALRTDLATSIGAALVGYIKAGTGAILRTIQAWLDGEGVQIEDFGGVGDGVALNDVALTKAYTAMNAAGGGVVWFRPGKTYLMGSVVSAQSGVTLQSKGWRRAWIKTSAAFVASGGVNYVINGSGLTDLGFINLAFDGNKVALFAAQPTITATDFLFLTGNCVNVLIQSCIFKDCLLGASVVIRGQNIRFLNTDVLTPGIQGSASCDGLYTGDTQNLLIDGCSFVDWTDTAMVLADGAQDVRIVNTYAVSGVTGSQDAIAFAGGNSSLNVSILGCTLSSKGRSGARCLRTSGTLARVLIDGCVIHDCGDSLVSFVPSGAATVSDVTLGSTNILDTSIGNTAAGINIGAGCSRMTIGALRIRNIFGYGIAVTGLVSECTIDGPTLTDVGQRNSGDVLSTGIYIQNSGADMPDLTVRNVLLRSTTGFMTYPVYVDITPGTRARFRNIRSSGQNAAFPTVITTTLASPGDIFAGDDLTTPNGGSWTRGYLSEELTLSTIGTTTDTVGNLLPANAIIEAVVARVTVAITTATDWKLGDATIAGRFAAANAVMTLGSTSIGTVHADQTGTSGPRQVAAAKVRVTTTGTPGAGKIRVTVFYRVFVPPAS